MKSRDQTGRAEAASGAEDSSSTSGLRYPDFICIGAQKAGTTWLDRNLRRHPDLWLPPVKELQYFNDLHVPATRQWTARHRREKGSGAFTRYIKQTPPGEWDYRFLARVAEIVTGPVSDEWYGRIFALARQDQTCGEITPDYCTLPPEGIEHVLRLAPRIKIVLSLRDPIDRSWSHIRMLARNRDSASPGDFERFARNNDIYQRADYPAMIGNWRKYVPDDRMLVVFMDAIGKTPHEVLKRICMFLGVEYRPNLFKKSGNPVHVGEAHAMPPHIEAILRDRLRPVYDGIAQLYPDPGAAWRARHYG